MFRKCRSLHLLLLLVFLKNLPFSNSNSNTNKLDTPQFPCNPPKHYSYPFCNTSLPNTIRAKSLISLLTLQEKILQLSDNASGIPRLGIPPYEWWSESLHGIATNGPGVSFTKGPISSATGFPQVILTAAAFNRTLWFLIGSAIAVEARAMYNVGQAGLTFWAPNVNIFRDPRWGRGQETPGEDPMVVSAYAIEFVKGFQGGNWKTTYGLVGRRVLVEEGEGDDDDDDDGLMLSACCKHLIAYDLEKWGNFSRYNFNSVVTEQDLQDTYQPPFRSCVRKGKASCLMCSYNEVNGVPACASSDLLQKARTEWGFKGYIVSDCDAVATIYEYQHYSPSAEDAVAIAFKAGTDINCGTYTIRNAQFAVDDGKLNEEDIDGALLNLFSVQLRLGMFDGNPRKGKFRKLGPQHVCTEEHKNLALEAARQGIVLLKNEKNFLPLNKKLVSSLAIVGPLANNPSSLGGDYTGYSCTTESLFDGFKAYIKESFCAVGCPDVACDSDTGFEEAISYARVADIVVVVAGIDLSQETEDRDRISLLLPGKQMDLVSAIATASKKPVILVLTGGGPLDVSFAKADPRIASILWIGYPGEGGPKALAEIIFGGYNPGGRLPMTWYPESFTKVPMTDMHMRADPSRGYPGRTYRFYTGDRVYGFGEGLSYTKFSYKFLSAPSKLSLSGSLASSSRKRVLNQRNERLNYVHVNEIASCESLRCLIWSCFTDSKATNMSLQLADRSIIYPRGIVEDVLVKVRKFIFPIDFVVLDIEADVNMPLILGRPFLATSDACINVRKGQLTLKVGDEEQTFNVFHAGKYLHVENSCCMINDITFGNDEEVDKKPSARLPNVLHSKTVSDITEQPVVEWNQKKSETYDRKHHSNENPADHPNKWRERFANQKPGWPELYTAGEWHKEEDKVETPFSTIWPT